MVYERVVYLYVSDPMVYERMVYHVCLCFRPDGL